MLTERTLLELLAAHGIVSREELREAALKAPSPAGSLLVALRNLPGHPLARIRSAVRKIRGVPKVRLDPRRVGLHLFQYLPAEVALAHGAVPFRLVQGARGAILCVAFADPLALDALLAVHAAVGMRIAIYGGAPGEIERVLAGLRGKSGEEGESMEIVPLADWNEHIQTGRIGPGLEVNEHV